MKEIGGYFSLEISPSTKGYIHSTGIHLNSGRNALEYVLQSIPNIKLLWIPYYTCDVVLASINKLKIPYNFYHINEKLEMAENIDLSENEYLLVTNYFGIKDNSIKELTSLYKERLIVDNAQALYATPIENIKTIYSPRKFVGLPDGGIAYTNNGVNISDMKQDISYNRCSHLLKRLDLGAEAGYSDFRDNSHQLNNQSIKQMSNLTWKLLQSIDWEFVKKRRRENFELLHKALSNINLLNVPPLETFACPMVYPLYTKDSTLKRFLIENKIFVATYWPNVLKWCKEDMKEYELANNIIAIPIDQRYDNNDMNYIINIISEYTSK